MTEVNNQTMKGGAMSVEDNNPVLKGRAHAWVVTISAAFFFFYIFIQMNFFSAIEPALFDRFHIGAAKMASVSQMYFYGNVLFLIPAGLLLDYFSTRRLLLVSTLICVLSTWWFARSGSLIQAEIARFFIGMAGAFCLLGPVRLATRWFPPAKIALVVGVVVTMAMVGGMVAQTPFVLLANKFGCSKALYTDVVLGIVIWFLIFANVQDNPSSQSVDSHEAHPSNPFGVLKAVSLVVKNKQNWLAGLYASLVNLPVFWLGGFWGVNYLVQVHHLSRVGASSVNGMIFLGLIVGCPLFGWWSDTMKKRKPPMIIGAIAAFVASLIVIWFGVLSYWALFVLFFIIGLAISSQVIAYPVVAESNPLTLTGSAESVASVLIMAGGFTLSLFAWLLNYDGGGVVVHSVPVYSPMQYHIALSALLVAFFLALMLVLGLRETNCQACTDG